MHRARAARAGLQAILSTLRALSDSLWVSRRMLCCTFGGARPRQLIDDAAAVLGKTRTEFMVESARRQAVDVLLDQRLFTLDPERYDAFMQALDNPPAPGPKLKALLRRTPAWQK